MRRILFSIVLFSLVFFTYVGWDATAHTPQGRDPVEVIQERGSNVVSTLMQHSSWRTARFNAEMSSINLLRPLDAANLSAERIPVSIKKIQSFLDFLGQYRDSTKLLVRYLEDSVAALRADMPHDYQETFMSTIVSAYKADAEAFDAYTLAISSLHKQVAEVLRLIEHSKHKITNGSLEFTDQEAYGNYQTLMAALDKRNSELKQQATKAKQTQKGLQQALETLFADPGK